MPNPTGPEASQPAEPVAQVRRFLRQREYRRAIETIDRRLAHLPETVAPVPVPDIRTYAYERLVRFGPEPPRRTPVNLRRGAPVSLRRNIPVDLRRLTRSEQERVLGWLLSGELRAAEEAMRAGDYPAVVAAAEFAARVDDRSTRISLLHGRSLYELAVAALDGQSPDLDDVLGQLQRAARLVTRASVDPALRSPKLAAAIDELARVVQRRRARAAQIEAVRSVVRRFDRLVQHYDDGDQVVSHVQLGNARASLAQILADADRLSRQHPTDSPAGRVLADVRTRGARYKLHLERLGRSVRVD